MGWSDRLMKSGGARHSSMDHDRCLRLAAATCLLLIAAVSQAAVPEGMAVRTHLKYAGRASLAEPALRSSAALVLDTTHSSVLYSRRSDIAMPIASITKLMTALVVWMPTSRSMKCSGHRRGPRLGKGASSRLAVGTRADARRPHAPGADGFGESRGARAGPQLPRRCRRLRGGDERQGARARDDAARISSSPPAFPTRMSPAPTTSPSW